MQIQRKCGYGNPQKGKQGADLPEEIAGLARNAKLTRPRPGHADMAGMQKFGFDEARPLLERASARETATRVALGRVAQHFLAQLGITTVSHTVVMGDVAIEDGYMQEGEAAESSFIPSFNGEGV